MNPGHVYSSTRVDDDGPHRVCYECGLVHRVKIAPGHLGGRSQWQREVERGKPGVLFIVEPPCDPRLIPPHPRYFK